MCISAHAEVASPASALDSLQSFEQQTTDIGQQAQDDLTKVRRGTRGPLEPVSLRSEKHETAV